MNRHQRKKTILIVTATGLALGLALGILGWLLGWFGIPKLQLSIGMPGSSTGTSAEFRLQETIAADLEERMLILLRSSSSNNLAAWYQPAGRLGKPAAIQAADYLAADQLRYGQYLLEQGKRQAFINWWQDFCLSFLTRESTIAGSLAVRESADYQTSDFWRNNLAALRLLAQSCVKWPDRQRQAELKNLSGVLLSMSAAGIPADFAAIVPTAAPTLNPAATPTPKPQATPTPSAADEPSLDVLRLASLDLYTMQQLAQLDIAWQAHYEHYLPIVRDGYLGDRLPLYAFGYDENQQGYLPFTGDSPAADTGEALLTVLHLCEAGQEVTRSLSWIRDQLYNEKAIYTAYHIAQGSAASTEECVPAYAIVARIARIIDDPDLYAAAVGRLLWHQATSQRSEVLSLVFRQDQAGLIRVLAEDNTWALLAIR